MRSNKVVYIIASVVGVFVLALSLFLFTDVFESDSVGSIKIELVDLDGTVLDSKRVNYSDNATLEKILKDNFNNVYVDRNGMLQSIGKLNSKETSFSLIYIAILVDGQYSDYGVWDIQFDKYKTITFKLMEYRYETNNN